MVWNASSSREGDSGLQSKVFKNPSPRAHSSYHLRQMLRDCQQNIWGIWKCSHIIILRFQIWLDNQIIVVFTYLTEKYGDTGQRPKHKMNTWLVINYFWKNTFNSKRVKEKSSWSKLCVFTSEQSERQPKRTLGLQETFHCLKLKFLQQK